MDLKDLIARLEASDGPDSVLDDLIDAYDPRTRKMHEYSRCFTSSLDDALALKERLLPGYWMQFRQTEEDYWFAIIENKDFKGYDDWYDVKSGHKSPAIALLIATLRAYEAEHGNN